MAYVYVLLELVEERKRGVGNAGLPKGTARMPRRGVDAEHPDLMVRAEDDFCPIYYKARYYFDIDHQEPERPALVVFTEQIDETATVLRHVSFEMAEQRSFALIYTSIDDLQKRAFSGNPHGLCIVNPPSLDTICTDEPITGLAVEIGKLEEWLQAPQG
jgi:hypothetical protein